MKYAKKSTTKICALILTLMLSGCGYYEKDLKELEQFNLSVGMQRSEIDYQELWLKLDKHYHFLYSKDYSSLYSDGKTRKYCFDTVAHTCTLNELSQANYITISLTPNKSYRIKFNDSEKIISIKKVTDHVSP